MNNDVESFRELYGEAIHWTDDDFKKALAYSLNDADGNKSSIKSFHDELENSIKSLRNGSRAVMTWSEAASLMGKGIKTHNLLICLGKTLKFNRYSSIAIKRLFSSRRWKTPFDVVDKNLSEINYSVWQDLLQIMHEKISWGHNWFSVGEWSISNNYYVNALIIAIATNNIDAIEAVTHFLVDTYIAGADLESAIKITQDFIDSQAYRKTNLNYMTRRMLESIAVGRAMEGNIAECQAWLNRISDLCETESDSNVSEWNLCEWLTDVYSYKNDSTGILNVNVAIRTITKLRKNWEDLQRSNRQR